MLLLMLSCGGLLGACNGGGGDDTSASSVPPGTSVSSSVNDVPAATSTTSTASTPLSPVPKVFDAAAMQTSVQQILSESYQIDGVESVTCPPAQPVRVGETFDCTAQIAGKTKRVAITVKSADGHYEVGQPR